MVSPNSRSKRSIIYSIIILLVLGIFTSGYLFYFIPHNRQIIHKNGFQLLSSISTNIENEEKGHAIFLSNLLEHYFKDPKNSKEECANYLTKFNILLDTIYNGPPEIKKPPLSPRIFQLISGDRSVDSVVYNGLIFIISKPTVKFLEPLLISQKKELFGSYCLIKVKKDKLEIVYQDDELAFRSDMADSILPKQSGLFAAGMKDIVSKNINLKMFYYPFSFNNTTFILSGFVDAEEYDKSIRRIPYYFIYPLVIIFLLLLIFFPVIKFHFMDSNEQLRVRDVIFFGFSAFIGTLLLTILILQIFIWQAEKKRVENNLMSISNQISTAFNRELKKIYKEIGELDSLKKANSNQPDSDITVIVKKFLQKSKSNDTCYKCIDAIGYYNFDRISWLNLSGQQFVKAELYNKPIFANVGDRNYLNVFKTHTSYLLPGDSGKRIGFEPIYSNTNGDYNISVSKQSVTLGDTIVAMATKMYSLVQTILPEGYGFCILNDLGAVQVHSDSTRNLRENFLDKTDKPGELIAAMYSRQSKMIDFISAYGNINTVFIQPLDQTMPFHLVCFYDAGNRVPVNMRILLFTLLLCFVFLIICVILWLCLARRGVADHPLVYSKMDFLNWISPKSRNFNFYFHGFIFMASYTLVFCAIALTKSYNESNNFNVLALLLVTPVNIILVLYCMSRDFINLKFYRKRTTVLAGIHMMLSLIFYFLPGNQGHLTYGFLIFQFFITAIIIIYSYSENPYRLLKLRINGFFVRNNLSYKWLVFLLIISLAVLPATFFTWYAHNQELIYSVKKEQLHLANSIRERSLSIQQSKPGADDYLPEQYFDSLQYSYGIYKINNEQIKDSLAPFKINNKTAEENYYFDLAEAISIPYYNNRPFGALRSMATDGSWDWAFDGKKQIFQYSLVIPGRIKGQNGKEEYIKIASDLPDRFSYTTDNLFLILIVCLILLYGLFRWVAKKTDQIFLTRFIQTAKPFHPEDPEIMGRFRDFIILNDLKDKTRLYTPMEYPDSSTQLNDLRLLDLEKRLVEDIREGNKLYQDVWDHCNEKEKFLLLGFAQDEVINYKNTKELIDLMSGGILMVYNERIKLFSPAFRGFLLTSIDTEEIEKIQKQQSRNSSWKYFQIPLMVFLVSIAAMIFLTQEGIFNKILGLAGGVSSLIGLVSKVFTGNSGSSVKVGK